MDLFRKPEASQLLNLSRLYKSYATALLLKVLRDSEKPNKCRKSNRPTRTAAAVANNNIIIIQFENVYNFTGFPTRIAQLNWKFRRSIVTWKNNCLLSRTLLFGRLTSGFCYGFAGPVTLSVLSHSLRS